MTNTTTAQDLAREALEQATDYGTRSWLPGNEPKLTYNDWNGSDIRRGDITYRLCMEDVEGGQVEMYVFTGGRAMILSESAKFSAGLAHLAAAYIAEALR